MKLGPMRRASSGRDRPHSSWFDSRADTGAVRWQRLSQWVAIAFLFALSTPHLLTIPSPIEIRCGGREGGRLVSIFCVFLFFISLRRHKLEHPITPTRLISPPSRSPCHRLPCRQQIYTALAIRLDSVWLQQITDRCRKGNRISCLTSGTFSHPAISQCHFGIISLLAMIHDWNSFWPWLLRENVWQAVEKNWEIVEGKTLST